MELIIEVVLEIYFELMFLIVPEKNVSKRHIWIAKILALLALIIIAALLIWGLILIFDYNNMWGIVPAAAAILLSLAQIIGGIVLYSKHH